MRVKPSILAQIGPFFLPPGDDGLAREVADLTDRTDLDAARKVLAAQYVMIAHVFPAGEEYAEHMMHGLLTHLVRRHGPTVASPGDRSRPARITCGAEARARTAALKAAGAREPRRGQAYR